MSNLLLIDFNIYDKEFIINNLLPNTKYIEINSIKDSYSEIQIKIQNLNIQKFENISIIRVNDRDFFNLPIYNLTSIDSQELFEEKFNNFRDFLLHLKNQYEMQNFDIITCNAYDLYWQQFITAFKNNYNLYIRSSSNITGLGGDWILESDNVNLVNLYFNKNIVNYNYSLDLHTSSFIVDESFNILACGDNSHGKLGVGDNIIRQTFVDVNKTNITGKIPIKIDCGFNMSVILMSDGTVYTCGFNRIGQLGNGSSNSKNIFTDISYVNIPSGVIPISISSGVDHTLLLMSNGTVYGFGTDYYGGLGTNIASPFQTVATGDSAYNTTQYFTVPTQSFIDDSNNIPIKITNSGYLSVLLMSNNDVFYSNYSGFYKLFSNNKKIVDIVYSGLETREFLVFITLDGEIYSSGYNYYGQLGINSNTNASSPTKMITTHISDKIPIQVSCGVNNTIVLMSDGTLFGCGLNTNGELGTGDYSNKTILTPMSNINFIGKKAIQVHCGIDYTFVLMTDGTVYSCGSNNNGSLGIGSTTINKINVLTDISFGNISKRPIAFINELTKPYIITTNKNNILNGEIISITGRYFYRNPFVTIDGSLVVSTLQTNGQITFNAPIMNIKGSKTLTVSNDYGTSDSFSLFYLYVPVINYLDISFVSTYGGKTIIITGLYFINNPVVKIDGSLVSSTVLSPTQISFITPVNTPGSKTVTVSNDYGTSDYGTPDSFSLFYIYPPIINNLDISFVSILGGQTINIIGNNFTNNPIVKIDGSLVSSTIVSSSQISFITPIINQGSKLITVTNDAEISNSVILNVLGIPTISNIDSSLVSVLGGETIIITGTNFTNNSIVNIDGSLVSSTFISLTQISCITNENMSGNSLITITNFSGTSQPYPLKYIIPLSNICFPVGTPIRLDQGIISIEKINPKIHTIRNNKIETITKTITQDKYLVCIEKDALGKSIPNEKTIISLNHKLLYNGSMIPSKELLKINNNKIYKVKYCKEVLYNVLLYKHDKMVVNNLICETLDPENNIAKMHYILKNTNYSFAEEQDFIKRYNDYVIENKVFSK